MGQTNDKIKYVITGMTVNDIAKWCEDNGFTGGKSSDGVGKIVKGKDGKNHAKWVIVADSVELVPKKGKNDEGDKQE